jgi:hypothetical protein
MQELTTSATLVEYGTLDGESPFTAVLARSELESALTEDPSARLWFELEAEGDEQTKLLTIDMVSGDLEEMLARSTGDEIVLALDENALASLFDGSDVEAHGLRGALAVAVATAAIAAPAGLAATAPLTASAASTVQRAGTAATVQTSGVAATTQVASLAAKTQVSGVAAKSQVSRSLVARSGALRILRAGVVR